MIRMIVSDLDGTLLDDAKKPFADFEALLDELNRRGIMFATASGRTYASQLNLFPHFENTMKFICDNGAYIAENGKIAFISLIDRDEWRRVVEVTENCVPEAVAVLCGVKGTYCRDYTKLADAAAVLPLFYPELDFVDELLDVDDEIFKVSVCCPHTAGQRLFPVLSQQCKGRVKALLTDPSFVDVINADVSKGTGVEFLQRKYNIDKSETMVFGDYYNDTDMLCMGDYSYIMDNAPLDMRNYGKYLAPDNNSAGVATVIKEYLSTMP